MSMCQKSRLDLSLHYDGKVRRQNFSSHIVLITMLCIIFFTPVTTMSLPDACLLFSLQCVEERLHNVQGARVAAQLAADSHRMQPHGTPARIAEQVWWQYPESTRTVQVQAPDQEHTWPRTGSAAKLLRQEQSLTGGKAPRVVLHSSSNTSSLLQGWVVALSGLDGCTVRAVLEHRQPNPGHPAPDRQRCCWSWRLVAAHPLQSWLKQKGKA